MSMMDVLSTNCQKLRQDLLNCSEDEKEKVVLDYLESQVAFDEPIADFPADCDWFNVSESLSLNGNLRGKIVVLDFFTYCCINCMHILPDLAALEERYPVEQGVVVVGVHSAKFANEKESRNILAAAQRYNIAHPVVNDSQFRMWKALNVHCWPTLLVLGPKKNPLFVLTGEGHGEILQRYVAASLKFFAKEIKSHSLPIRLSNEMLKGQLVKFPAKVACNSRGSIAVSDSGNHRILILSKSGVILEEIGGCGAGFKDGSFVDCRFNSPQGLCFYGPNEAVIFVADTENHAIRRIDLQQRIVDTVVGTGKQGNDYQGGRTKEQAISSPWDVVVHRTGNGKEMIVCAMAGTHQIWSYFIEDCKFWRGKEYKAESCAAVAGNGHEQNKNNSYPNNAAFAQPSGLAMDTEKNELFIADSESSTVRKIVMADGKVQGVVGGDRNPQNLFAFGDLDGKLVDAKLQHPLGVCFNPQDKFIYVADTYNHKIKRIHTETSTVESMSVVKNEGSGEQAYAFNEPGGLCVDETGEILIVANTNHHSIDFVNLKTNVAISLDIRSRDEMDEKRADLTCPMILGAPNGLLRISFDIKLGQKVHFTEGAPQRCVASLDGSSEKQEFEVDNGRVNFKWKLSSAIGKGVHSLNCKVRLSLCENDLCFPMLFTVACPVEVKANVPEVVHREFIVNVDKGGVRF